MGIPLKCTDMTALLLMHGEIKLIKGDSLYAEKFVTKGDSHAKY